jgi:hypothetical protein
MNHTKLFNILHRMRALLFKTCLFLLIPAGVSAQQKSEYFFSGNVNFNASMINNTSQKPSGGFDNDITNAYGIRLILDYGKFIKDNGALQFGLISGISYSETNRYKVDGENPYFWDYEAGAHIAYTNYFDILPRFYATLRNDLSGTHSWVTSNDYLRNQNVKTELWAYRLSPGLFYRIKPKLGLNLSIDLATFYVQSRYITYSFDSGSSRNTNISLSMFSRNNNINALYFGVIWFPADSKNNGSK